MGASLPLPKPVESTVVERQGSDDFYVAVAEMNGWRNSMEDAHLILLRETYGVFGVFDGHGGGACSEFVAKRLGEELGAMGCPEAGEMKKLFHKVDQEFLDSAQTSGSTATMCVVRNGPGAKRQLLVVNAGDSRVLLGRRDGSIVDGGGTDKGLTTDHKPDHPGEKSRIERCGGTVELAEGGVARVNGNLAVSRGFGDKEEKSTGGPGPEERPVTVDPETGTFECDSSDFLLLVCDGVSEGNFPNTDVVKLVASLLREGKDLGEAVKAVCHKAVATDSKDNITCMGVLLSGGSSSSKLEFNPGPVTSLGNKGFRTAYSAAAERAGLSLVDAVMKRYDIVEKELKANPNDSALKEELGKLGVAPAENRKEWFQKWLDELPEENAGPGGMDMEMLQNMMGGKGGGKGQGKSKGYGDEPSPAEPEEVEKEEDGYTWSQKGEEVHVAFKLPQPVTKKDVKIGFKQASISVLALGKNLLDGSLGGKVDTDCCTWYLVNGGTELNLTLTKQNEKETWPGLLK
ncbi:unnamed protein product [Effrenium voratum]|uniref:protein-serine/threonine phosphatase n=1 Tax=Effrenium voratum TaxID=2562239 RepID=A0AA36MR49_9DINO|nr:unnamed protein product [Effrenium voratum]CAJ1380972.1 unnamed protein product [Effrenium voratum]CAJ1417211.1 unnamed protein product [Effrenium voratum]